MFRVDLQNHPAYRGYEKPQSNHLADIERYIAELHQYLLGIEKNLTFGRRSLIACLQDFIPRAAALFGAIESIAPPDIPDSQSYLTGLWREFLRLTVDDLAYFERRGCIEPIIENQTQLNQYWDSRRMVFSRPT